MEFITSLFGSGAFGKLVDLVTIKFLLGSGLPGVLMAGSLGGFIFMVKNHVDPTTNNKLLAKGYIIRDLGKLGFLGMTFITGVLLFIFK